MTDKFFKTISKYQLIPSNCTIGIGLSGGADSVSLLHLLVSFRERLKIKKIIAVHINHGIRGAEADNDMYFAEKLCENLGVEFISFSTDIPAISQASGEGVEECARRIRYDCFEKVDCDVFATAHNLNDNVETFFLNLTRGSSLNGLCGIPYKRGKFIRPLLDCTRNEIENYIADNKLEYVTDSTNLSDDYTRNNIRHNILPQLFEINPSFDKAFSRCINSVSMSNDYISIEAQKLFEESKKADYYDCKVFENCHPALKHQIISLILKQRKAKNINREHILSIDNIIADGGSVDIGDCVTVTIERKKLFFGKAEETEYFELDFDFELNKFETPGGEYSILKNLQNIHRQDMDNLIDCDKISGVALLRNRKDGESYIPRNRKCTKTLKRLFNDNKIDVSDRSKMLILSDEVGIVWTEYFGVADRCKCSDITKNYILIKRMGK